MFPFLQQFKKIFFVSNYHNCLLQFFATVFCPSFLPKYSITVFLSSFLPQFSTKVFCYSFLSQFSPQFSITVFYQSFLPQFSTTVFYHSFLLQFSATVFTTDSTRVFCQNFLPQFSKTVFYHSFLQQFYITVFYHSFLPLFLPVRPCITFEIYISILDRLLLKFMKKGLHYTMEELLKEWKARMATLVIPVWIARYCNLLPANSY